jgi:hypothetical protein
MKKISTIIITLLVLTNFLAAQNFSIIPKVGKGQASTLKDKIEIKYNFTNNSLDATDTMFSWKLIEINMPSTWTAQICDPFACLEGSGTLGFESSYSILNSMGNNTGVFLLDFFSNGNSGTGVMKVAIKSVKTGFSDTIIAEGKVWPVSVKETAKQNKEFSFYPNPAKDELVLKYNSKENFQVEIFNILGSKVKTFSLFGGQTTVNIQDLENGIYFLRFKDDGKTMSKTFTKN